MPYSLVPVFIKPYLVPFLYRKLKCEEVIKNGKRIKAARVDNKTNFGRIIRLLFEKSDTKPECDSTQLNYLLVANHPQTSGFMSDEYKYADGRYSFLYLPQSAERLINEYLEEEFETACMYYIHSRHQNTADSLDSIILDFFKKYNLEDHDFNTLRVRRSYYRKLKSGYFSADVYFDTVKNEVVSR